ncbi:Hsp20/alpha crystallin family protein [Natronolimnohabitans sp. A-GB9]|uniref:Hsp20/alpha crystallin family protein n=1 Tax=Natronolimnohabitans sp. A-GB9 TaxID=3069757 RepID=UPI0027B22F71|nr:Hsp20/alpha crystallin family protein [Natronolimnohabitans sp. A-GB9]MDQ2051009.1 Hsp20/alpha crystallin family protein [Natronolimnohabitans sp. A-GB9]
MSATSPTDADGTAFPFPLRLTHDRSAGRLEAVVDVFPADVDDLTVEASAKRLRLVIDRDGERTERTVPAPGRFVFGDDREAVYNNGVLSVSLETSRHYR